MGQASELKDKLLHGSGLFTTFLRSTVSSQICSWTDMTLRMILFAFVFRSIDPFYRSNLSVFIGAFCGGVMNCCINYRFTFRASGQSVKAVGVKFLLVWTGSMLLNMYGTTFAAMALSKWQYLYEIGFKTDGIFAATTLGVSLIVSLAWNFLLQRTFVFRPTRFDKYAIAFVDLFIPKHRQKEIRR